MVTVRLRERLPYIYIFNTLVDDLNNLACTNGTATFADSETKTFVHSDRVDELNGYSEVVTRHNHLYSFGE